MPLPVLCVGAAHWDLIGRAGAPLAPGGDVPGRVVRRPGGVALNVALALAALGRPSALVAAIGTDPAGDELVAHLVGCGVDCGGLARHAAATDAYLAVEDASGALFAAVADCAGLERAGARLLRPLADAPAGSRVVADGNLPAGLLLEIAALGTRTGARLAAAAASPAKADRLRPLLRTPGLAIYLNRLEAEALCSAALPDSRAAAAALIARGLAEAVVTDGSAPATHATADGAVSLAPPPASGGATGAGDAFLAAHLAALDDGLAPEAALRAALAAGSGHVARAAS